MFITRYTNIDYYTHCKEHKKCKICGAEFETKKLLKIHMKIQHSRKLNNNQNSNSNAKKSEEKVKCSDCDLLFNIFIFFHLFLVNIIV